MQDYRNARTEARIEDWPMGRGRRGVAEFVVEKTSRGERLVKVTTFNGRSHTPKKTTFCTRCRLVEGADDGRLYLLERSRYGHLSVVNCTDFKMAELNGIFEPSRGEDRTRWDALNALLDGQEGPSA